MWFILFLWIVDARTLVGSYTPQTFLNGSLTPKQCHGSTGFCWCIDSNGNQIGESVGPGIELDCY